MTKALDASNERARQKQLAKANPQPYHRQYIEAERTCPHCDSRLRMCPNVPGSKNWARHECDCSWWEQKDHPASFEWTRQTKPDTIKSPN